MASGDAAARDARGPRTTGPWAAWSRRTRWLMGTGLLLSLGLLLLHAAIYRFLTDDAYISFRYARNLSHGFGLVFNPGFERVEGYSNFLWVLVLAGLDRIGLVPERGALVLSLLATVALWAMVAAFGLRGAAGSRSPWDALVPLFCLAATRSVAVWSSGGLETRWFEMLIVAGVLRLVVEIEARLRREVPRALSPWLFALATWTRPDGLLLSCAAVAAATFVLYRRRLDVGGFLRGWLPFALLVGGHIVFRRIYYHAWLPNTYYAKVDGRQWWGVGLQYLAAFALEYGAYLWIPLLAAAVLAHRQRRSLFVPGLFASLIIPHALYVASIGGDHFEFRPLTLYFPFVFLLLADGMRFALDRPRLAPMAAASLGVVLVGLWVVPWQSHLQFPRHYVSGFPGRDASAEAGAWLSPDRGPIARLPVIRSILTLHRRLLGSLSSNYVGLRAEEHRLFLATVAPDGVRLRGLIDRGLLPRDLHLATGCVGVVPYDADVRTLDLLGLTDAHVAHQPFREKHSMGHDKLASQGYVRRSGVDMVAVAGVHPFLRSDSDRLVGLAMDAIARPAPWRAYAADIGNGDDLVCAFPQGAERAFARMPRLRFQMLADSTFARPLFRQAVLRYQEALRRDPTAVEDHMVLGDLLLFQDEFAAAAESYEDALRGGVETMQLRMNLATAYERGGLRVRAIPSLERALVIARAGGDAAVIANVEVRLAADTSHDGRRGRP